MRMKKVTTMGRSSMKQITMNIPVLIRIFGCRRHW
jgi:hypothetical protein